MITVISTKLKPLSGPVDDAAKGKPFIYTLQSRQTMVKVVALDTPSGKQVRRLVSCATSFRFQTISTSMGRKRIEKLFGGRR